jgi:hypothetical protein
MISLFCVLSRSWWGHTHMIVGRIAESFLSANELKKYENALAYGQYPRQTITETSVWHDDLKDMYSLYTMGNWHFEDQPLIKSENVNIPPPTYNISSYLDSAWRSLSNTTTTDPWIWSFHIRGIVHFLGDIHTPHHCCALFNDDFPSGDYGGNRYKLNCPFGSACNNMHFLWDSVGFYHTLLNPLNPIYKDQFQENVTKMMEEFPESTINADLTTYNPSAWNAETFKVAEKHGYGIPMYSWPTETYLETVRTESKKLIVLAGYRLGHILKSLVDRVPGEGNSYGREIGVWIFNVILVVVSVVFLFLTKKKKQEYVST